jgi:hypothetical protein
VRSVSVTAEDDHHDRVTTRRFPAFTDAVEQRVFAMAVHVENDGGVAGWPNGRARLLGALITLIGPELSALCVIVAARHATSLTR